MDAPAPLLVAAVFAAGCASADLPAPTAFWFEHEGNRYAIVSVGTVAEPANDLLRFEDTRVVLQGRDRDQNGVLDTVLIGSVPLAVADAIYLRGIEIAHARGAARRQDLARTFELRERGETLVLTSVARGGTAWANQLVRYSATGQPGPTYTDADADGTLDGPASDTAQADYERVLNVGLHEGRVERVGDRYRVRVRPPRLRSGPRRGPAIP